ncbi:hypothetical protein [Nocardia sp. NPDC049707]|uniref:hypothetical protein n=1 Tax=Nocardia sp. NPDC049707 TaxID=3154735 RepID=UPI003444F22C
MSGLIEFSDGTFGFVGDDGWVEEFDAIEVPVSEPETTPALGAVSIDIDAASVIDTELPQRTPLIGPRTPVDLPVELVERIADAVREWADPAVPAESSCCRGVESPGSGRTNYEEA